MRIHTSRPVDKHFAVTTEVDGDFNIVETQEDSKWWGPRRSPFIGSIKRALDIHSRNPFKKAWGTIQKDARARANQPQEL